jgi:uncharacterized protein YjbJ (UPF0337 family)
LNWDIVEGQWKQLEGGARQRWAKLTADDWELIGGKREELVGRLQERYGKARDEAEVDVEEWTRTLS